MDVGNPDPFNEAQTYHNFRGWVLFFLIDLHALQMEGLEVIVTPRPEKKKNQWRRRRRSKNLPIQAGMIVLESDQEKPLYNASAIVYEDKY